MLSKSSANTARESPKNEEGSYKICSANFRCHGLYTHPSLIVDDIITDEEHDSSICCCRWELCYNPANSRIALFGPNIQGVCLSVDPNKIFFVVHLRVGICLFSSVFNVPKHRDFGTMGFQNYGHSITTSNISKKCMGTINLILNSHCRQGQLYYGLLRSRQLVATESLIVLPLW